MSSRLIFTNDRGFIITARIAAFCSACSQKSGCVRFEVRGEIAFLCMRCFQDIFHKAVAGYRS